MKPIAVLCADLHMQTGAWAHRAVRGDAKYGLEQIVDLAIELRTHVIGAGDLIDRQRNMSEPIVWFAEQMRRLHNEGLCFYYVQGQHELQETPWLEAMEGTVSLHQQEVKLPGLTLYGLDYQPTSALPEALETVPDVSGPLLLVMHQVWVDLMGDFGGQARWSEIPNADILLTGDYHGGLINKVFRCDDGREMRVINPGSTCMQSIDEPEDKFCCVLWDDLSVKPHKLRTRPVLRCGVVTDEDGLSVCETTITDSRDKLELSELPEELRMPLVQVAYHDTVHKALSRLTAVTAGWAHLFAKQMRVLRGGGEISPIKSADSSCRAVTLPQMLPEYLKREGLEALQPDCERLLGSPDTEAVISQLRREFFEEK